MDWKTVLKEDLKKHEGLRLKAYKDTVGVWTIGYGATRAFDGSRIRPNDVITQEQAEGLLQRDMEVAIEDARKVVPCFDELNGPRKTVMANMAFNLGPTRLAEFKNTIHSVCIGDYKDASLRMLQSRWAGQVGQRSRFLSNRMLTGEY
jgi:lysozyme